MGTADQCNGSRAWRHGSQSHRFAVRVWSNLCICSPGVVELVRTNLAPDFPLFHEYSTVQYSTVQYQYRHNEGGDCLLSTEILQHQASPGLGSWEGGQLLCHSTWPTNKYIRYLDTYNMYNMTPSSKVPLDQSRLHTAMLTSCPYYNVKLSKVVLKLPLLTYSDHKVTFTNPKLTNKVTWS